MSLRKTVNFSFSRTLPEQLLVVAKSGEQETGENTDTNNLVGGDKTEAPEQDEELRLSTSLLHTQTLPSPEHPWPGNSLLPPLLQLPSHHLHEESFFSA